MSFSAQINSVHTLPYMPVALVSRKAHTPSCPPIYYINRDQDNGRRASMERRLEELGLEATRVSGINGLAVPPELVDQFFTNGKLHSEMRPGEVGCYASHLMAMRTFLESDHDYAIILEDDAVFDEALVSTVKEAMRHAPKGWGVVNLCRQPDRAVRTVALYGDNGRILRCSRIPPGAVGLIVSRIGAERITAARKRRFPVDIDLRTPWLFGIDVFCLSTQLVTWDPKVQSVIHQFGGQSKLRRGMPRIRSYCWTGNPIHSPLGAVYNIRKLGLKNWVACCIENALRFRARRRGLPETGVKPSLSPVRHIAHPSSSVSA